MKIRIGTEADAESIKGLDDIASVDRRRLASIDRWLGRGECWVAIVDEQIVAYAAFNYSFYGRGFVEMLYVHRKHRRRGIGLAFMRHFAGICDTSSLFTSTNQSNVAMQHLLAQAGFEPSGKIENLDEGDPELVYFRQLQNSAV